MCFIKDLEKACKSNFKEVVKVEFTIDEHTFMQDVFLNLRNKIVDENIETTDQFFYMIDTIYNKINDSDIDQVELEKGLGISQQAS